MVTMEQQNTRPFLCTTQQVAALLDVKPDTVRKLVQRGHLTRAGGSPRHPWYALPDVEALHAKRHAPDAA